MKSGIYVFVWWKGEWWQEWDGHGWFYHWHEKMQKEGEQVHRVGVGSQEKNLGHKQLFFFFFEREGHKQLYSTSAIFGLHQNTLYSFLQVCSFAFCWGRCLVPVSACLFVCECENILRMRKLGLHYICFFFFFFSLPKTCLIFAWIITFLI